MKITAALAVAPHSDFSVETVDLGAPTTMKCWCALPAWGCATDLIFRDQFAPLPLPAVLGHEGAGVVEAVGGAVTDLAPGDTVVLGFSSCGRARAATSTCPAIAANSCRATMPGCAWMEPARSAATARR
jgi:aryl-alcohol dehydrogenase